MADVIVLPSDLIFDDAERILPRGYNVSMSHSNSCEQGHLWDYNTDFCQRCGMTFDVYQADLNRKFNQKPCTCGAEKSGFDSHTHWCDRK